MEQNPIQIEIWRGLVSEVKNIPEGLSYVIRSDIKEEPKKDINVDFSMLIQERMTEDEFWAWIRSWKDGHSLIEEAENWDTKRKKEEVFKINQIVRKLAGDPECQ